MSFLNEPESSRTSSSSSFYKEERNTPEWCEPNVTISKQENVKDKNNKSIKTNNHRIDSSVNEKRNSISNTTNKKKMEHEWEFSNQEEEEQKARSNIKHNNKHKVGKQENDEEDEDDIPLFLRDETHINAKYDVTNNNNNEILQEENSSTHNKRNNATADFLADIINVEKSSPNRENANCQQDRLASLDNSNVKSNWYEDNVPFQTSAEQLHFVSLRQFEWNLTRIRILGKGSYGCATLYKVESFRKVNIPNTTTTTTATTINNNDSKVQSNTIYSPTASPSTFTASFLNSLVRSSTSSSSSSSSSFVKHFSPEPANVNNVDYSNEVFAKELEMKLRTCPFVVVKDVNVQTMQNLEVETNAIATEVEIMFHLQHQHSFIQLYDFYELPSRMLYIILEYCSGGDLAALLECVQAKNASLNQSVSSFNNNSNNNNNNNNNSSNNMRGRRLIKRNEQDSLVKDEREREDSQPETKHGRKKYSHSTTTTNNSNISITDDGNNNNKKEKSDQAGPRALLEKYGSLTSSYSILQALTINNKNNHSCLPRTSESLSCSNQTEKATPLKYYFSEPFIASVLIQLLLALHQLQITEKVIHRDIKPHNLFITLLSLNSNNMNSNKSNKCTTTPNKEEEEAEKEEEEFVIRLADFGVAVPLASSQGNTSGAVGSPLYMAPEVIAETRYSFPADVWSIGVVLYELICLERPFNAIQPSQLAKRIASNEHVSLLERPHMRQVYSLELLQLVESLLQVNPSARPLPLRLLKSHYVQEHLCCLPQCLLGTLCMLANSELTNNENQEYNDALHRSNPKEKASLHNNNNNSNILSSSQLLRNTCFYSPSIMSLFNRDVLERAWAQRQQLICNNVAEKKKKETIPSISRSQHESEEEEEEEEEENKENKYQSETSNKKKLVTNQNNSREDYWNDEYADDEFESDESKTE